MYTKKRTPPKQKSYKNGFVNAKTSPIAYLQGYKLIAYSAVENENGFSAKFNVTKNSRIVGKCTGIYIEKQKCMIVTMMRKKYILTKLK